jgi:hypothetical protein
MRYIDTSSCNYETNERASKVTLWYNNWRVQCAGASVRKNTERERGSVVAIKILLCYASADEDMKNELKAHLSPLERISLITIEDPSNIDAGTEWKQAM